MTFTFQFISRVRSVTNPWLWVAALQAFPSVGRLLSLGGGRFPQRICSLVIPRKGNVRADSSALPAVTFDLSLGDAGSRKDPGSISGYVPWLPCTHFGSSLFSSFSFSRPRFDGGCTLGGGVVERPWLWWVSFVGFPLKRESWLHAFPPVVPDPPTKGEGWNPTLASSLLHVSLFPVGGPVATLGAVCSVSPLLPLAASPLVRGGLPRPEREGLVRIHLQGEGEEERKRLGLDPPSPPSPLESTTTQGQPCGWVLGAPLPFDHEQWWWWWRRVVIQTHTKGNAKEKKKTRTRGEKEWPSKRGKEWGTKRKKETNAHHENKRNTRPNVRDRRKERKENDDKANVVERKRKKRQEDRVEGQTERARRFEPCNAKS